MMIFWIALSVLGVISGIVWCRSSKVVAAKTASSSSSSSSVPQQQQLQPEKDATAAASAPIRKRKIIADAEKQHFEPRNTLERIPLLIWSDRIFCHLDVVPHALIVPQVCKYWNLAAAEHVWKKLDLQEYSRLKESELRWLSQHFPEIEDLTLSGCNRITSIGMVPVAQAWNLKTANLNHCKGLGDIGVMAITRKSQQMQILNMDSMGVSDSALVAIGKGCKRLKELSVVCNSSITDIGVECVARNCSSLQKIDLSGCAKVTDSSIFSLSTHCKWLSKLHLSGCTQISDTAIHVLAKNCNTRLQVLDITECCGVGDGSLLQLSLHCGQLTAIAFGGRSSGNNFSDEGIMTLCRKCTKIKKIYMDDCHGLTDRSILSITESLKELQVVGITNCIRLTEISFLALAKCETLQKLNATGCNLLPGQAMTELKEKFAAKPNNNNNSNKQTPDAITFSIFI